MNQELLQACEMAKLAADMSLPLEKKPAPEAGSQPVQGMTDNSTYSPTSVGASTYAGQVDAAALAKARAAAAMAMAKQAGIKETYNSVKRSVKQTADRALNGYDTFSQPGKDAGNFKIETTHHKGLKDHANDVVAKMRSGYAGTKANVEQYGAKAGEAIADATKAGKNKTEAAIAYLAAHKPQALMAAGAVGLAGAGYAGYRHYKEKKASAYEDYMDKLASVEAYGVTPEEAYFAAEAAVELYNDCLEKMAYAEELFNDADNYFAALEECEEFEKQAAEYMPIASSTLGALAGATAGYVAGAKFPAMRNGVAMAGMATAGAAAGSALNQFAGAIR